MQDATLRRVRRLLGAHHPGTASVADNLRLVEQLRKEAAHDPTPSLSLRASPRLQASPVCTTPRVRSSPHANAPSSLPPPSPPPCRGMVTPRARRRTSYS